MSDHRASRSNRASDAGDRRTERRAPRARRGSGSMPWWRSVPLRAALSLGLALGVGSAGTFAYWTDSSTVTGITFTAGTLDLKVNNLDNVTGYTSLNISNMIPGQSVAAVLTVKNAGNVGFTYTANGTATNVDSKNLRGALVLKVTGGSVTGSSPSATCSGSALTGSGTSLGATFTLLGTARSLAASASEPVCVEVSMPSNASSSLQGSTTDVVLTFTATQ
ncbi:MAG: TasA family protein [Aeromicrobium sp.]